MDIQIYNRNLELTDRIREYVEKKVGKLDRFLPEIEDVRVDLSATTARDQSRRMVAQCTIYAPRAVLRAEERAADIFAAIDAVVDKMTRQIERYKGRRSERRGLPEEIVEETPVEPEPERGRIVRVKEFPLHAITPEQAAEEMELLGHQFYIFLDAQDGRVAVVYKRNDGDYGVLKPVF